MKTGLVRTGPLAVAVLAAALAACSAGSSAPTSAPLRTVPSAPTATAPAAPSAAADWPTYHGTPDRAGAAPTALRGPLRVAWRTPVDAAVYAQPITADGLVITATENNTVYAVDPGSGRVVWQHHLEAPARRSSLPCGNIDPSGITGTPAYDASTHLVFVVTEGAQARHTLVALAAHTGAVRWQRNLDVAPGRDPLAQQERGALLVTSGHVYVPFGGRNGDCGNYVGYLAGVAVGGSGPVLHYEIPTAREAGMWAPPGPVVGAGGDLYVASGNGAETGGRYDGSDSVVRLSPTLRQLAVWAPSTWPQDNAEDLDLGSMAPVPLRDGVLIAGKRGVVYLLRSDLSGDQAQLSGCAAYGGGAARTVASSTVVVLPCDEGLRALLVQGGRLKWLWHNGSVGGSPVIAGDVVYGFDGGDLVGLSLATGHLMARVHVGDVTRFTTAAPIGATLVVGTTSSLVAVRGT